MSDSWLSVPQPLKDSICFFLWKFPRGFWQNTKLNAAWSLSTRCLGHECLTEHQNVMCKTETSPFISNKTTCQESVPGWYPGWRYLKGHGQPLGITAVFHFFATFFSSRLQRWGILEFLHEVRAKPEHRVLVNCVQGISRSPAVVAWANFTKHFLLAAKWLPVWWFGKNPGIWCLYAEVLAYLMKFAARCPWYLMMSGLLVRSASQKYGPPEARTIRTQRELWKTVRKKLGNGIKNTTSIVFLRDAPITDPKESSKCWFFLTMDDQLLRTFFPRCHHVFFVSSQVLQIGFGVWWLSDPLPSTWRKRWAFGTLITSSGTAAPLRIHARTGMVWSKRFAWCFREVSIWLKPGEMGKNQNWEKLKQNPVISQFWFSFSQFWFFLSVFVSRGCNPFMVSMSTEPKSQRKLSHELMVPVGRQAPGVLAPAG